ncbi:MAG: YibE/F family protein [Actinophytocola sp.]|nr:YibE/F family protein [Actinophytocola sp.]
MLIPFALAAVAGTVWLFPFGDGPDTKASAGQPVRGVVTGAQAGSCNGDVQVGAQPEGDQCLVVTVRMDDGDAPGREIRAIAPLEPGSPRFAVDDKVVLSYGGGDPTDGQSYQLVDFQRDVPLALLAGLFAVVVLVLGRWQGLKALLALGVSFGVLVLFVLPAIIAGENPLLVAIFGAGLIMFAVLYLTHGLTARTSTAVLGTMVSLAMIGVLGALWAAFASLTGLDEDTATLVGLLNNPIDTRGLLLAGVVIGALGVLDDVTITQTSAVWELRAANPALTRLELYTAALRIGRDHVASAVNTLVMAYAGAALPLLLYSSISGVGLGNILTSQSIAQELVRTLVGSIGLVAAVPITTFLAAAVAATEPATGIAPPPSTRRPTRAAARDGERTSGRRGGERKTRPAGEQRRRERDGQRAGGERRTGRAGDRPNGRRAAQPRDGRAERTSDHRAEPPHERRAERTADGWFEQAGDNRAGPPPERRAERTGESWFD